MIVSCKKDEDPKGQGSGDVADTDNTPGGPTNLLDTIPAANYNGKEFLISIESYRKAEVIAEELTGYFMADLEDSRPITLDIWEARPDLHGVYESVARLFSPLL